MLEIDLALHLELLDLVGELSDLVLLQAEVVGLLHVLGCQIFHLVFDLVLMKLILCLLDLETSLELTDLLGESFGLGQQLGVGTFEVRAPLLERDLLLEQGLDLGLELGQLALAGLEVGLGLLELLVLGGDR